MMQMRKSSRSALAFSVVVLCAGYAAKARAEPAAVAAAPTLAAKNDAHDIRAGIPQTVAEWGRGAMLFDGLGDFHRKATTSSAQAQKFFDQGMRFLWRSTTTNRRARLPRRPSSIPDARSVIGVSRLPWARITTCRWWRSRVRRSLGKRSNKPENIHRKQARPNRHR